MDKAIQYELHLAQRMSRLGTETAFEVLNKARALERSGKNIIHLEIGEPDFDTPANIVEAGIDALREGWTHYGPSAGLPELRQAIAEDVSRSRGVRVASDEVVVVPGGKPIIFFTILALAEAGDEVIYPNPGFPIYESMIHYAGARPVPIRLREEKDFGFDVDEMASLITDRTRLIILNSPQNPTGGVLGKQDFHDIAAAIGDRNIMVLSDEIYSRLVFEGEHYSIMSVPGFQERTIVLDGFSKTYAMTGWRMGYGVMRPDLAAHITRLMTNSNSPGPPRRFRGRTEPDQRIFLPYAQRSVLRIPQHHQNRMEVEATGGRAAGRGWGGGTLRRVFRGIWGRLFALQRSQFVGEPEPGAGTN